MIISALYVDPEGCYHHLPGVDVWDVREMHGITVALIPW